MKLSVCFITGRAEPHVEWVLQAIVRQRALSDAIDFIIVDALGRSREALIKGHEKLVTRAVQDLRVVVPKPNIWQGKHRVTPVDFWAKSAASNTALCLAKHDYVAFLDDCARPGDAWLDTVRVGCQARESVLAGAYTKVDGTTCVETDHRLQLFPKGKQDCGGGWLYGCSFALPLEWCLQVNGFEEGCDGLSAEDTVFGCMLANNGHRIDFSPALHVTLERSRQANSFVRIDKGIAPNDKSHAARARFEKRRRTEFTVNLTTLRTQLARGGTFPIPDPIGDHRDWFDGSRIREADPELFFSAGSHKNSMKAGAVMHEAVMNFGQEHLVERVIRGRRVLEVGSMNVNGSLRAHVMALGPTTYVGIDFAPGNGVDVVCDASEIVDRFGEGCADVVISTEMLEHAEDWRTAISNMKRALVPDGGFLLLTARGPGFQLHGYPSDWWRFTLDDMRRIFADFEILALSSDGQAPGVLLCARSQGTSNSVDLARNQVAPADEINAPR